MGTLIERIPTVEKPPAPLSREAVIRMAANTMCVPQYILTADLPLGEAALSLGHWLQSVYGKRIIFPTREKEKTLGWLLKQCGFEF